MASTRRLAAILAADVAGYSRLMGADEEGTHERLQAHRRELLDPKIGEHSGRVVKNTGDGLLAEFPSVVDAVRCAVELQRAMIDREADISEDHRIRFRIGINLGDVIVEDEDIFGDGVNVAARLEALAEPGGICISQMVHDQIHDKLLYVFEDLGEQSIKNIARLVRVYVLRAEAVASLPSLSGVPGPSTSRPAAAPRLSIVVLPFANLSRDPEQEYYADGITDDLTTDLSRIPGSFVIARSTAFTYKGKSIDAKLIGQELGVRYILEGSVRQARNRIRINVQLIDAESGGHVWADRFETERKNVAEAEDEIIGRLACILKLELVGAAGRQIEHEKALDPDVHDLVMRGWAWYHRPRSKPNLEQAQQAFEQALRADPQSIEAKVGIATVLAGMVLEGWSQSLSADQARIEELLTEVFAYSANHSMAHYAMAMLRRSQKRLSEARIAAERAVILDHNNSAALCELGLVHLYLGHPAVAIAHIEKAIRLSPRDPFLSAMHYGLGRCHLFLGHLDEAITLFERVRTERPAHWDIHMWLAGALALNGDLDGARIALAEARRLKPEINSLDRWREYHPWITSPQYRALRETTLYVGLRRAG